MNDYKQGQQDLIDQIKAKAKALHDSDPLDLATGIVDVLINLEPSEQKPE